MTRWKKVTRKILAILFVCILLVPGGAVYAEENVAQDVETQEPTENQAETEQKMTENQRGKTEKSTQNEIVTQNAEAAPENAQEGAYEVWTGYSGSKVAAYSTLQEAFSHTGDGKMWVVVGQNCTLNESVTIPSGVYLDVAAGVNFTIGENGALTVAADCKRLGVRTGATVTNKGTILVCGTDYSNGKILLQDGGKLDLSSLSFPEGYGMCKNGTNYFGVKTEDATFKVDYADGSTMYFAGNATLLHENASCITLLKDATKNLSLRSTAENCILDLGGHTWTGNSTTSAALSISSAVLTIKNGTVKYTGNGTGEGAACIWVQGGSDITVDSDVTLDGGQGIGISLSSGKILIKGKVTSENHYAITGNGENIGETTVTIADGAEISAPNGTAIYHPHKGTLNVTGGKITGEQGIEMSSGTLNISGAPMITSTGDDKSGLATVNVVENGIAVSLLNRNYPGGKPSLNISADCTGKLVSKEGIPAVRAYVWNDTEKKASEWDKSDVKNYVKIAGGWFSSKVNQDWCAEGYKATDALKDSGLAGESAEAPFTVIKPEKTASGTVSGDVVSDKKADIDKIAEVMQKEADQIAAADSNENLLSIRVELQTERLTEATVPKKDLEKLKSQVESKKGETVTMYVDVSVWQTKQLLTAEGDIDTETSKLSTTRNAIPVTLKVPGIGKKFVRVLHVHDGVTEELPCIVDRENETIQISMNKFSTLAVVTSENVKVTFDSQGGSNVGPVETIYGGTVAKPADPTRTGYSFLGWYRDSEGSQAFDFTTALTEQDVTLYAKWKKDDSDTGKPSNGNSGSPSGSENPTNIGKPSNGKSGYSSSEKVSVSAVKTGDQNNIWLPVVLCAVSLCGVAGSILFLKRKKY